MEIGSFIELQFMKGHEYYHGLDMLRLNTGRAAIYHSFVLTGAKRLWLPYYQCESVKRFLERKNVPMMFYHIDYDLAPKDDLKPEEDDAVLIVNYYGLFDSGHIGYRAKKYPNPIIDNSQAFFCSPVNGAYNVYSCRKFIGVPDGSYVIGKEAATNCECYEQGYSSSTAKYLLERIEFGCEPITYDHKKANDFRLDHEDVKLMSKLTHTILDGTDYNEIRHKRIENFNYAKSLFDYNLFNIKFVHNAESVPMVYPFVIEDEEVAKKLKKNGHYQGPWWEYLVDEMPENTAEYWLSKYMIPITIDQRYGKKELDYINELIDVIC